MVPKKSIEERVLTSIGVGQSHENILLDSAIWSVVNLAKGCLGEVVRSNV